MLLSMAAAAASLSARARPGRAAIEAPPNVAEVVDSLAAARRTPPRPPKPHEVRDALRRVWGGAVTIDPVPAVAADFNGDGSEDLAALVRAAPGTLARLNHELANWTLQDAAAAPLDPRGPRAARVNVEGADALVAVIHGYGATGWRNPEARQSYLVRNTSLARPRVATGRGVPRAGSPRLRGHAIEDARPGHPGFLYWSASRYVWASPPGPEASP